MARPVTLFTGQWADLPLEELAKKAAAWGYDGVELACWGDHFEVDKALKERNLSFANPFLERLHHLCGEARVLGGLILRRRKMNVQLRQLGPLPAEPILVEGLQQTRPTGTPTRHQSCL